MLTMRLIPLLLALLLAVPPGAVAQLTPQGLANTPNVKDYGRAGYPRVTVYVWGTADTGVWTVEKDTDLLEFLSVAVRSDRAGQNADTRVVQTLKIYREETRGSSPYFEARLDDLFSRERSYPSIQDGDIIEIESQTRRRFTWRDITQVTGTLASLVATYLLVQDLNNN